MMPVALNLLEDIIHYAALLLMPFTFTVAVSIIVVLVWGKTLHSPRNAIYWVCAVGCAADTLTVLSINLGGVLPARGWMPRAYVRSEVPSRVFMAFMWSSRAVQMNTAILLALNRLTAMWSSRRAIVFAVGAQLLSGVISGGVGFNFDTFWYHSNDRGFWYTMLAERQYTKVVLATAASLTMAEMLLLASFYCILLVKMRSITRRGNSNTTRQGQSLLHLAVAVGVLELFYNITFACTHVLMQDFNSDPRILYVVFVVQYNVHSTAQPLVLIYFCKPAREGLKLLYRAFLRTILGRDSKVRPIEIFDIQSTKQTCTEQIQN